MESSPRRVADDAATLALASRRLMDNDDRLASRRRPDGDRSKRRLIEVERKEPCNFVKLFLLCRSTKLAQAVDTQMDCNAYGE